MNRFHLDPPTREPRPVRDELDHMGQKPVTVTVPFPPSVNGLFANVARRGRVRSARYRQWSNVAGLELKRQKPGRVTGHVSLTIEIERKDERRRDVSNFLKAPEDLLVEHGIIQEDSLVTKIEAEWTDGPGCKITIRPSEPRFKRRVA